MNSPESATMMLSGQHTGSIRGYAFLKEWKQVCFSRVYSGRPFKPTPNNQPRMYGTSVHEGIGHGYLARTLTGVPFNRKELILMAFGRGHVAPLIEEGIADYAERLVFDMDPHEEMKTYMISAALDKFMSANGEWRLGQMTPSDIREVVKSKSEVANYAIKDFFKLKVDSSGNPSGDYSEVGTRYRGGSFVGYFIAKYGVEMFKEWVGGLKHENFFESLTKITGKSLVEIEREWKETVLSSDFSTDLAWTSVRTPELYSQLHNSDPLHKGIVIDAIKNLYRTYS